MHIHRYVHARAKLIAARKHRASHRVVGCTYKRICSLFELLLGAANALHNANVNHRPRAYGCGVLWEMAEVRRWDLCKRGCARRADATLSLHVCAVTCAADTRARNFARYTDSCFGTSGKGRAATARARNRERMHDRAIIFP